MRGRILLLLGLGWLAIVGAYGGCGLFTPATPEVGQGTGGGGPPINRSLPDSTLSTMALAMSYKINGDAAYVQCLSVKTSSTAAFTATFDPAVIVQYPSVPAEPVWGNEQEQVFYDAFVTKFPADEYQMTWDVDVQNPDDPSHPEVIHRRYQVFTYKKDRPTDQHRIAVGYATLTFARDGSGNWLLAKWEDRVDPTIGASPDQVDDRSFSFRRLEVVH